MRILLIDCDSVIPNIALMKLSTYHKNKGDSVKLIRCKIPYYPQRKKSNYFISTKWDRTYCSVVFEGTKEYIKGENIIFGGTGHKINKDLPDYVERLDCDYSLYPNNKTSYGFLTRGCIRKCSFCKVPEKEGYIRQVAKISDIVRHRKVKFLDNNILALPEHNYILSELAMSSIRCQFNQGLDIRLINKQNSYWLSCLNYDGEYTFAFDNWSYRDILIEKLKLLKWRKEFGIRFFVYVTPTMTISNTINRIELLKKLKCLPYVMRDISCFYSENNMFFTDLAAWCNQPSIFKKMDFDTFMKKKT